jgi:cation:H+ antiporter
VLGLTALVSPAPLEVPPAALRVDIPIMLATLVACLPVFFAGYRIARWEGFLFLGYYVAFVMYLLLASAEHDALPRFSAVMLEFVVPLTVVTLIVSVVGSVRRAPRRA